MAQSYCCRKYTCKGLQLRAPQHTAALFCCTCSMYSDMLGVFWCSSVGWQIAKETDRKRHPWHQRCIKRHQSHALELSLSLRSMRFSPVFQGNDSAARHQWAWRRVSNHFKSQRNKVRLQPSGDSDPSKESTKDGAKSGPALRLRNRKPGQRFCVVSNSKLSATSNKYVASNLIYSQDLRISDGPFEQSKPRREPWSFQSPSSRSLYRLHKGTWQRDAKEIKRSKNMSETFRNTPLCS